jgi:outer membrane protein assembly factor BamE
MSPTTFLPRCGAVAATALALLLAGCSGTSQLGSTVTTLGGVLQPYKNDVLQGNVVTREQFQALQAGMTRDQVRGILGTPLLSSLFHAQRWDYVFTLQRQGQASQQRKVTLYFNGDLLERFSADELPSEAEFVASIDRRSKSDKVPTLEASEEQLKAFEARNPVAASQAPVVPAAAPATSYPPLESR